MLDWDRTQAFDDTGIDDRRQLIDWLEYVMTPPNFGELIDQIAEAIQLAAAGETEAWLAVDGARQPVREVIDQWSLDEFVERAKAGNFSPRGWSSVMEVRAPAGLGAAGTGARRRVAMRSTCFNVRSMPKMIQIRNVPDDVHRKLKVRAAESGLTLSGYILRELEEVAGKPSLSEFVGWLREQPGAEEGVGDQIVEMIRERRGPLP